jgi:hypothetical protein
VPVITPKQASPGYRGRETIRIFFDREVHDRSLGFKLVAETHKLVLIAQTQILPSPSTLAAGAAGHVLGTARASDAGGVIFEVTLPPTTKRGHHELVAKGSDGRQARAGIEVA